ncbi:MAG: 2-C-methyl-D-erythritol 2,4-cyclodiphosphate synthase [Actinobacteria bacterium]|nr:2-C-methyl-D-erythritol 2,4-cyclodiphosphate synthase [Actinomycetota bacterium]
MSSARPPVRIGQGVDAHRFGDAAAGPLVLGGVTIPGAPRLAGHSDGDALLHAVVDALLGAVGLGDIGALAGVDDPRYAGAGSRVFVDSALRRLRAAGWTPGNVDCTVMAERPRLTPHRAAMVEALAGALDLPTSAVSVKATTTDGLGLIGAGEGVACLAVALVHPAPG